MKGLTMNIRIDEDSCGLPTAQDERAIAHTLQQLLRGFKSRDARLLNEVYAEDADWINAFGSRKRGCEQIVDYLRGLFADDNFNAGKLVAEPEITLRMITKDVVLVSGHLRVQGQRLLDGGVIEERDNHSIRVLQRQADGRWLIVSEMYMDANTTQSYAGHS
jgi:uncharacterized protein (TIGR02246 family)